MRVEHFVTVLDSSYLPQLLALYNSLNRVSRHGFQLWVIAIDSDCNRILRNLSLENLRVIHVAEIETDDLLEAKSNRSAGEYCWTLTPVAPLAVFERDLSIDRVTYIDADLWFLNDPLALFGQFEASSKDVMMTLHGYNPIQDQSARSGKFCVQFMVFTRAATNILEWWREKCVDWCYVEPDNGRLGDQKYLEEWPDLFGDQLHISDSRAFLAPWNAMRYPYSEGTLYHFHGCRLLGENKIQIADYPIPDEVIQNIYKPYFKELADALDTLNDFDYRFKPQAEGRGLLSYLRSRGGFILKAAKTIIRKDTYRLDR